MSTAPQENIAPSRTSTSDPSPSGPLPSFDHHLKVLSNSYLSFFEERKRIEETYVESLTRLHRKVRSMDTFLDDRSEPSTTRSAWYEVRDNVEREAQTRQAFLSTLTVDVVNPLAALKETQDRTRKRIKEDLKESSSAYNDYVDNMLPKLKRTYLRRCQEVEDHKAASMASTAMPAPPPPTSPGPHGDHHNSSPPSRAARAADTGSKPVVTAPQPLRPLDRRPSGSAPQPRNRSPSTTTAFSDLAQHGKKQLNQLKTFLDKSNTVKDLGGRGENSALRAVRAKREADEADKEYRRGVHWAETLRLRRTKTLESGFKSLEMFVHEAAATVKMVLEKYADNMTATSTTQTQLSSHARSVVDRISPERDASVIATQVPRSLASAVPPPILYYNYHVGESKDLIFGVSLADYATARSLPEGDVPKIVRMCIDEVDQRGLDAEGIYRVSGRHANVQELQAKIERDEDDFQFNPNTDDVYAVSSLLKLYLRELPEPVFKYALADRVTHTEEKAEHLSNNFMLLRAKMRRLPPVHQATLKAIVEHLARVAANSEKNKMDPKNLAIIFGAVIFGEDEMPKGADLLTMQSFKDSLMEDLIVHADTLFDERGPASAHGEAPLPAAPSGEAAPTYPLGSQHTKVANMLPHGSPRSQDDFTPKLPPRPAGSIHPSARANPTTPADEEPPSLPPRPSQIADRDIITSPTAAPQTPLEHRRPHQNQIDAHAGEDAPIFGTSPRSPRTPKSATASLPESSSGDAAHYAAINAALSQPSTPPQ